MRTRVPARASLLAGRRGGESLVSALVAPADLRALARLLRPRHARRVRAAAAVTLAELLAAAGACPMRLYGLDYKG